ncbi:MAG TPA: ABC transporter permease [Dehalococcoidales bacterium]|nr:ABC transporter permease [Dehalococcoidales bacterium]
MSIFSRLGKYIKSAFVIAELELRKIRHDQTQIWIRTVQPALWLVIYGYTMSNISALNQYLPHNVTYLQFMTPGILAQSVLFVAIFFGITVVWERDLGLINKLLSTPAPRSSIVIGKALSAGVRGIFQTVAIIILALIMRIHLILNPLSIFGLLIVITLLGMCFSALSMALAPVFKTRERMMGIGQAITMPLFFASSAIYPIEIMPSWIKPVAVVNPLTYVVSALRGLLATGDLHQLPLDIAVILGSTIVLLVLASVGFKRLAT